MRPGWSRNSWITRQGAMQHSMQPGIAIALKGACKKDELEDTMVAKEEEQARKGHININFLARLPLGRPQGCHRNKPSLTPGQTQFVSLFSTAEAQFVPWTNLACLWDKPGRTAAEIAYVLKVYTPFSLPRRREENLMKDTSPTGCFTPAASFSFLPVKQDRKGGDKLQRSPSCRFLYPLQSGWERVGRPRRPPKASSISQKVTKRAGLLAERALLTVEDAQPWSTTLKDMRGWRWLMKAGHLCSERRRAGWRFQPRSSRLHVFALSQADEEHAR